MHKLIKELRRREVFRTAGLYVGIAWIAVEVSSVLFDAFAAPDWALQAVIIIAIIGLPVTIVLAWVFDITEKGIEVQADATDTMVIPFGGRRMDFVVIGVLSVALIFSIYLNVSGGPSVVEELKPISILVADFDNSTGQALFDGLVEQALNIGIEGAPHVTAYGRNEAKLLVQKLRPESTVLDAAAASLVAVREGINLVLTGSIAPAGAGFDLAVSGVNPKDGRKLFEIKENAGSADAVLATIGDLSSSVREELGDTTLDDEDSPIAETFTAASIEAARAYVTGGQLAFEGKYEAAVEAYQEAIRLDENFGRAYASLGLSAQRVGQTELSEQAWEKALSLMDTMTEREKLRTLGVYYASVSWNFRSAIDNFSALVEKYPADVPGRNNLAVVYFYTLDFDKARDEGKKVLEVYPDRAILISNYALYAMYASDFDTAAAEAKRVVEQDSSFYKGYLPQAIAALDDGEFEAAKAAYDGMSQGGVRGQSLGYAGLADMHIYRGHFEKAVEILEQGAAFDEENQKMQAAARKYVMLAEAHAQLGNVEAAHRYADKALELDESDATSISAAFVYLAIGESEPAMVIAERLSGQIQPQRRAYGAMLYAQQDLAAGRTVEAIDKLTAALDRADLWLIRLQLGKAFLDAGYGAEAMAEFEAAKARRGEASAAFLDDVPTFRYLTELPYWSARAELVIGMNDAAQKGLDDFLELRPEGGRYVEEARTLRSPD
jgi:tetratricopeptide (TPR) repeat protein